MRLSILSFLILVIFALSSCDKSDFSKDKWDERAKDKEACFELVYPVTFIMPDGSTVTGGKEEVWGAVKVWYAANPDSQAKPELQYPVDIKYKDGSIQTISDEEDMIEAKKDCFEEDADTK